MGELPQAERLMIQAERWHQTCELVSRAGSHEAKVVVALTVAAEPRKVFRGVALQEAVTRRQGEQPAWEQGFSTALKYCRNSLMPLGYVVKADAGTSRKTSKPVEAYRFNPATPPERVGALGLLADWSLRYTVDPNDPTELSLHRVCGSSSTGGSTRAAEARFNLFAELLTADTPPAVESITGLGDPRGDWSGVISPLEDDDLVEVTSAVDDNDRHIKVVKSPRRNSISSETLHDETELIHQFLADKPVGSVFTHQELLDYVFEHLPRLNPAGDQSRVRRRVRAFVFNSSRHNRLEFIDSYNGEGPHTHSRVSLNPRYAEPIEDLTGIVMAINDGDEDQLAHGYRRAMEIIDDPEAVHTLMAKARCFSSGLRSTQPDVTRAAIMDVLRTGEARITTREITRSLRQQGMPISPSTVYKHLKQMKESGQVLAERSHRTHTHALAVVRYALAS